MPYRNKVKVGDQVKARWFDDPRWYKGTVFSHDGKLAIPTTTPGGSKAIGYLDDADEVRKAQFPFFLLGCLMEDVIRLFRKQLFSSFYDWVETNKEAIGEKWHKQLSEKGKDAEDECDTALKVMGTAMWVFNMIANCGVLAGIGPNKVNLVFIAPGLDENSSKRLLHLIAACMSLQYLPKEMATQSIPIISGKKFSLKLFTQQR
jgi:hypothetical protein